MRSLLYSTWVRPRGVCVSASGLFYFAFCLLGSLPSHTSGFHSKVLTMSYFECVLSPHSRLIPHLSCRGRCYTHTRVQLLPWLTGFLAFGCIPNELLSLFCDPGCSGIFLQSHAWWNFTRCLGIVSHPFRWIVTTLLSAWNITFSIPRDFICIRVFPLAISVYSWMSVIQIVHLRGSKLTFPLLFSSFSMIWI